VLSGFVGGVILAPRVNCDSADNYSSIWSKVFSDIILFKRKRTAGFAGPDAEETQRVVDQLPKRITPEVVRQTLSVISGERLMIVIVDEFDRLQDDDLRRLVADTIKTLSDHAVPVTLVVVGVADTVDALIKEHHSIERALVQVQMPRMSRQELEQIVNNGLARLELTIEPAALQRLTLLSQGLPHYTHLLALYAAREAIDYASEVVTLDHVVAAIKTALTQAQQSIRSAHHTATMSPRKENLHSRVLLACALAKTDDLGYFAPSDVRDPLSHIMRKRYEIPSFARHLNLFCDDARGPVLQKIGIPRRYRYRFLNPLLQPFVIMQGMVDGLVTEQNLP
jgi:Cdc6-like AAA superfamily ATPase